MKHFFGKKSRSVLSLILMGSLMLHVVAIIIFGTIHLVSGALREETEFQAGPLDQPPQQQQEFEVNIEQPTESPPPRPDAIVVNNPSELNIPSLDIELNLDTSVVASRTSGSFTSGLDQVRDQAVDISFFGATATGNHFVVIMDLTLSGRQVFNATRAELLETLDTIRSSNANFMLIYFGGRDGGHRVPNENFPRSDFWYPRGISGDEWLPGSGRDIRMVTEELQSVNTNSRSTWTGSADNMSEGGIFFRTGTQFFGALNAAFALEPAPNTIFLLVEPNIAFPNTNTATRAWEQFQRYGNRKPRETEVQFIVGRPKSAVDSVEAVELMLNLMHGGNLSRRQIEERITYTE